MYQQPHQHQGNNGGNYETYNNQRQEADTERREDKENWKAGEKGLSTG